MRESVLMRELGRAFYSAPNSYIGKSVPRPNARRHLAGQGRFVADIALPRMLHVAFLRSPFAHATFSVADLAKALAVPGVRGAFTGRDLSHICSPWQGTAEHIPSLKSPPQHPLALDCARYVGEPVLAVVADSRAAAEDGVERIEVDWTELPAVTDMEAALDPGGPVIHAELGTNLCFANQVSAGDPEAAFAEADVVVEETFRFARHTGVCLEPRAILADYESATGRLTVHQNTQTPHVMQALFARHLALGEHDVRVIAPDVGGSFGLKVHIYADEFATAAISVALGRPVKFVADRLESFLSDIHARDHKVRGRLALSREGKIAAFEVDDLTGIGAYSGAPRTSVVEGSQVLWLTGAPYAHRDYAGRLRVVFQNKNLMLHYRAVGHPIAMAVTEGLVDKAAEILGLDPVEMRRRNYLRSEQFPYLSPAGQSFEHLSLEPCLDKLLDLMDYGALREDQRQARGSGIYRGIGLCTVVEITNPGPKFYGQAGAPIAAKDGCTMKLEPSGMLTCVVGVTEQGQGAEGALRQVAATAVGLPIENVRVLHGDTQGSPHGGGTWGSRGTGIGGEATLRAGRALRRNVLRIAASLLQTDPGDLELENGVVVDRGGSARMTLRDIGQLVYFRPYDLPRDVDCELTVTEYYVPLDYPIAYTNGIQASYCEVDVDTGFVRLLGHWAVEDCGRIINPMLVDEQIRGGIVQGLGAALFEEIVYGEDGQLLNGSLADYLVPMAAEVPDIVVGHVETPSRASLLGAKGAGEAGTAGASGAVLNAVNDALRPFGVRTSAIPLTPERILKTLGRV